MSTTKDFPTPCPIEEKARKSNWIRDNGWKLGLTSLAMISPICVMALQARFSQEFVSKEQFEAYRVSHKEWSDAVLDKWKETNDQIRKQLDRLEVKMDHLIETKK